MYVGTGYDHTVTLDNEGQVRGVGNSTYGELACNISNIYPLKIIVDLEVKTFACGSNHTVLVDVDGITWSFGFNPKGQLGVGDKTNRIKPTRVALSIKVTSVYAYGGNTFLIDEENFSYGCGANSYSELGIGTTTDSVIPKRTLIEEEVKSIAIGFNHTLFLTMHDTVYASGNNTYWQRGELDLDEKVPNLLAFPPVLKVEAGDWHSMVLTYDEELFGFGDNENGQLDKPSPLSKLLPGRVMLPEKEDISSVYCGSEQTFVVTNNSVYAFGSNAYGQLGICGSENDVKTPAKISFFDGMYIETISGSATHTIVQTDSGIFSFGKNDNFQCGFAKQKILPPTQWSDELSNVIGTPFRYSRVKSARK